MNNSVAGVTAAKIDSNTPHTRRKHRRAKSGSKLEPNAGDGNGNLPFYISSGICLALLFSKLSLLKDIIFLSWCVVIDMFCM